jgi:LCP family protein required for cell wall assembly
VRDVCNYLLLGSDSRKGLSEEELVAFGTDEDIGGENRADTIMLVHTDPRLEKAIILSFPRDLWVDIPGVGQGKLNSAFEGGIEGGGPLLVARTLHQLTGLRINHFLYVDLAGFQKVVEALGGVEMCIPFNVEDELTGLNLEAGCQTLPPDQALAYVRTRHLPCDAAAPDFYRISRQQQFLRAVINRLLEPRQLLRLPSRIDDVVGAMRYDTDLAIADLAYLVGQLRGISTGAAEFRAVPGTAASESGLSVIRMDPAAERIFRAIRLNRPLGKIGTRLVNTPPSPANVAVAVVDHGASSAARATYSQLSDSGFDVSPGLVRYADYGVERLGTVIAYEPGREVEAQVVAQYLPTIPRLVEVPALPGSHPIAVFITPSFAPGQPGDGTLTRPECVDPSA